jgi:hypothetical protein
VGGYGRKLPAKLGCNCVWPGEAFVPKENRLIRGLVRTFARENAKQSPTFVRVLAVFTVFNFFLPPHFRIIFDCF